MTGPPTGAPSASGSQSAAPSAEPSSTPTTEVPSPSLPPATATGAPSVVPTRSTTSSTAPLSEKGDLGNGVAVRVSKIESVDGEAQGPGEVAGPALRVSIEVENTSGEDVAMDLALTNLYYGKDKTPASALSGPGASPLPGTVASGDRASGQFVFGVPVRGPQPARRRVQSAGGRADHPFRGEPVTANVPAVRPSADRPDDRRPDARSALDLRGHFGALRRFWRSVLLCTLFGVLAAGAVT